MTAALGAEMYRLRTSRGTWLLVVLAAAVASLDLLDAAVPQFMPPSVQSLARLGPLVVQFPAICGALIFTTDVHHGTGDATLLATPRRLRLLAAKVSAAFTAGALLAAALGVYVVTAGTAILAQRGLPTDAAFIPLAVTLLGQCVAFGFLAAVGVGVGAIVRHQSVVVAAIVLWFFFGEGLQRTRLPGTSDFGLLAAYDTLVPAHDIPTATAVVTGVFILATWTAIVFAAGGRLINRRNGI